jgi:hypothetical protein
MLRGRRERAAERMQDQWQPAVDPEIEELDALEELEARERENASESNTPPDQEGTSEAETDGEPRQGP